MAVLLPKLTCLHFYQLDSNLDVIHMDPLAMLTNLKVGSFSW